MQVIGVVAQKGGTGKTTLSVHLAVQATLEGLGVLVLDMDPQASATAWWKRRIDTRPELLQGCGKSLPRILEQARIQGYDIVIADTAPHSSAESSVCARLSDHVIIPTRPAMLDLDAIGATINIVNQMRSNAVIVLNGCPSPKLYREPRIICEAREALKLYGVPVCEVAISQRAVFGHALIDGQTVTEFDPRGKAAKEIARLWGSINSDIGL